MIRTKWLHDGGDLRQVHEIRRRVFIEEQQIPEHLEMDGTDGNAVHLLVLDGTVPVATGRILATDGGQFLLGRIAVLKEERGKNYGDLVVRMLIRRAYEMGGEKQFIHAQVSVRGFYEKYGFAAYGDVYMEAGIPHVNMIHEGDITGTCAE